MRQLARFEPQAYALLRMVCGFLFFMHGVQKLFGLPVPLGLPSLPPQLLVGACIEFSCGLLVMIGWHTRLAAFLASGTMAVAYLQFHWKFAFDAHFFPGVNQGELAVVYCFVFLLIATKGSGVWAMKKD